MKEIVKHVTVRELYNILSAKTQKNVSWDDFLFQLSNSYIMSPTPEMHFHDRDNPNYEVIYILDHKEVAQALEDTHKQPPLPRS